MPEIALVTPSHRRDLARCELLCESVDRHVTGYDKHYIIVNDGDVRIFRHLRGPQRSVLPSRKFLPAWLQRVPLVRVHNRSVFLSLRSRPLNGWHIQQLVKLSAAAKLGHEVVVIIDSDIAFIRPFDVGSVATVPTPLHYDPGAVTVDTVDHARWLTTAYRLLGLPPLTLPADDYIASIVTWRAETVRALLARVEATSGMSWVAALARARTIAEFMLYGAHVATDPVAAAQHRLTTDSFSRSYWDGDALDAVGLAALVDAMEPHEVALHVQSFGATPVSLIRAAVGLS